MIVVCDPIFRGASHEKVNSGFLTAVRLAYPAEPIAVYAHPSHVRALRRIVAHDGVSLDGVEFVPTSFPLPYRVTSVPRYGATLLRVLRRARASGGGACIFLSFAGDSLWVIKKMTKLRAFARLRCALVLHGEFERIDPGFAPAQRSHSVSLPLQARARKYWELGPTAFVRKTASFVHRQLRRKLGWENGTERWFDYVAVLLQGDQSRFRYLALSPHIVRNAAAFAVGAALNLRAIRFPMNFAAAPAVPLNPYPRFAMLGGGATKVLFEVLTHLYRKQPSRPLEVRLISADSSLVGVFPSVTQPTGGRFLERPEIEAHLADVDVLLILYQLDEYRLSCSNNPFEALSYRKPIIHLTNESVETVNAPANPIGYRCRTVQEYADVLHHIVENYDEFLREREVFLRNIDAVRAKFDVRQTARELKQALDWTVDAHDPVPPSDLQQVGEVRPGAADPVRLQTFR